MNLQYYISSKQSFKIQPRTRLSELILISALYRRYIIWNQFENRFQDPRKILSILSYTYPILSCTRHKMIVCAMNEFHGMYDVK